MLKQSVYLIGPPGAGKTSIGRHISALLDFQFLDTDQEIVKRSGADIPWIFDIEGESGFRKREQQIIEELCQKAGVVLATGGGSVLSKENRDQLKANGVVVYLRVTIDEQLKRTRKDKNRPLLQCEDPKAVLEKIRSVREPYYLELADLVIDTDDKHIKDIAHQIYVQLSERMP